MDDGLFDVFPVDPGKDRGGATPVLEAAIPYAAGAFSRHYFLPPTSLAGNLFLFLCAPLCCSHLVFFDPKFLPVVDDHHLDHVRNGAPFVFRG
jgi:hypothetical protein